MPVLTSHKSLPAVVFTTGTFEYVAVSVVCLPVVVFIFTDFFLHPEVMSLPAMLTVLAMIFFVYLWLFSFELKVTPLSISYLSLFQKRRSLPIESLAWVEINLAGNPPYRMIFHPKETDETKPIIVNIKPLKKRDLQNLALFLPKVAPQVRYDERFLNMARGEMPSAFKTTARVSRPGH